VQQLTELKPGLEALDTTFSHFCFLRWQGQLVESRKLLCEHFLLLPVFSGARVLVGL